MPQPTAALLTCPIRGQLNATVLAKDGLTESEEAQRIDFLDFLLNKRGYPAANIAVETIVMKNLGSSGKNSLRTDVLVFDCPASVLQGKPTGEKLSHALLVAEIKRETSGRKSGMQYQLEPALRVLPSMNTLGVYWDDENRDLLSKRLENGHVVVQRDSVASLPMWGQSISSSALTYSMLTEPKNLLKTLNGLADIMRSRGVEDKKDRYTETVKLLLARYTDERAAKDNQTGVLELQMYEGADTTFRSRIDAVYKASAKRYSKAKTLFTPNAVSKLDDETLKQLVSRIQGFRLSAAANETMQQIFMSFVPAVFKKELSQYFTPISLIETVVEMVDIRRNDKIVDPAMGTADFLTSALAKRSSDDDIVQRLFGIDRDPSAYELAIVNMILNRDGQSNLVLEDSIANPQRWESEMDIALCNPPFGSRTIEKNKKVLEKYELGHEWNTAGLKAVKTDVVLPSQQLGILFVERCWQLLDEGGRAGVILPEGYLCGDKYLYFRTWLLEKFNVIALVELPRRIFTKSDADLRSNILILQKKAATDSNADHKVFASMVRKVGYKLGGDFSATPQRDPGTGLALHDENNEVLLDSDFTLVLDEFAEFKASSDRKWEGAHLSDITGHPTLDLKPRRLVKNALKLRRDLNKPKTSVRLGDVAEVVETTIKVGATNNQSKMYRAIEGTSIRAVEGLVSPGFPERAWLVAQRKAASCYEVKQYDIVVGLVRPERRNVGIVLDDGDDLIAIKDGVAVVRIKESAKSKYSQEWLFAALRSEETRIQLWTSSGGTSYGKLTLEQIRDVQLRIDGSPVNEVTKAVKSWIETQVKAKNAWERIGTADDRRPILNSPLIGLIDGASEDSGPEE